MHPVFDIINAVEGGTQNLFHGILRVIYRNLVDHAHGTILCNGNGTGFIGQFTGQYPEQGGFACTIRAYNRYLFPGENIECNVI